MGSAESERYDQVLDSVLVGPGVTAILLTCSYRGKEFIRVGYYLNNEYTDEELRENPPSRPQIDRLSRNILADKPRVTKFPIDFDPVPGFGGAQQWQQQQPGLEAGSAPPLQGDPSALGGQATPAPVPAYGGGGQGGGGGGGGGARGAPAPPAPFFFSEGAP